MGGLDTVLAVVDQRPIHRQPGGPLRQARERLG